MRCLSNTRLTFMLCLAAMVAGPALRVKALPPDPTNAALRYYQACLLYAKADDKTEKLLSDVAAGKAPVNEQIRQYIDKCQVAIKTIREAAQLQKCDWGVKYSDGCNAQLPFLGQARYLARLVIADARIKAADGKATEALEQCLVARKLARHVGHTMVISFLVGVAIDQMAGDCMIDILGDAKLDVATLDRLSKALIAINNPPLSLEPAMQLERETALASMTMDNIGPLVAAAGQSTDAQQIKKSLEKMGGEKFLAANRQYCSRFMDSLDRILASGNPYAQSHQELADLCNGLEKDRGKPEATLTNIAAPALGKIYGYQVKAQTSLNAMLAGIGLYKVVASTGRLPATLPAGLPGDLFSGKDFRYEQTRDGFTLHCQAKDLDKDTVYSYEFKVKR